MHATDLSELNGKIVLVCSAQDHRNPPTGIRGTLLVHEAVHGGRPVVEVELDFPQMFSTRAHLRRVVLTDDQVAQLLESDHYGAFALTIPDRLDPEAPAGNE